MSRSTPTSTTTRTTRTPAERERARVCLGRRGRPLSLRTRSTTLEAPEVPALPARLARLPSSATRQPPSATPQPFSTTRQAFSTSHEPTRLAGRPFSSRAEPPPIARQPPSTRGEASRATPAPTRAFREPSSTLQEPRRLVPGALPPRAGRFHASTLHLHAAPPSQVRSRGSSPGAGRLHPAANATRPCTRWASPRAKLPSSQPARRSPWRGLRVLSSVSSPLTPVSSPLAPASHPKSLASSVHTTRRGFHRDGTASMPHPYRFHGERAASMPRPSRGRGVSPPASAAACSSVGAVWAHLLDDDSDRLAAGLATKATSSYFWNRTGAVHGIDAKVTRATTAFRVGDALIPPGADLAQAGAPPRRLHGWVRARVRVPRGRAGRPRAPGRGLARRRHSVRRRADARADQP